MIEAYKKFWKGYVDFKGRSTRSDYWFAYLANMLTFAAFYVLLFVFGSGLIPTFLIRMNNDIRFVTIVKLYIPCELCRFLVESIGIVWTIPVSIFITTIFMKLSVKKRRKSC